MEVLLAKTSDSSTSLPTACSGSSGATESLGCETAIGVSGLSSTTSGAAPSPSIELSGPLVSVESLGFDFTIPADHCLMINGVPFETKAGDVDKIIDTILAAYKNESDAWRSDSQKYMAKSLAFSNAVKNGNAMVIEEINQLIDELFACELPFVSIQNKPTAIILEMNELIKRFQ